MWQMLFLVVSLVCGTRLAGKPAMQGIYLHGGKKVLVK